MPLTYEVPPEGVAKAAREGVAGLYQLERSMPTKRDEAGPAHPTLGPAVRVYGLSVEDLKAGRGVESARRAGWKFLVGTGGTADRYADVKVDADGRPSFAALTRGPLAGALLEAANAAAARPEAAQTGLTPRLLQVPGLNVRALWLHADRPGATVFIVLPPVYPPLTPYQVFTESGLYATLRALAASQPHLVPEVPS